MDGQTHTTHILDLPPELLEEVFSYLTYSELEKIRLTCKAFDTVSRHFLSMGLSKLGAEVDATIAGFLNAKWYHQEAHDQRRLCRGIGSLLVLAGLVHTTQACSVHHVRAGEFAPLPAQFLQDVEDAVRYASRRNPLVGRKRLQVLHGAVGQYFEGNVKMAKYLSPLSMFRAVVDVLASLPGAAGTMVKTEDGVRYTTSLPRVQVFMPPIDPESGCPRILLLKLVQLGMHVVSHYVKSDQVVLVEFLPSGLAHTKRVSGVRLEVTCSEVTSLRQLRVAIPSCFTITFIVPLGFPRCLEGEQEYQEFSHIFSICGKDGLPYTCTQTYDSNITQNVV